MSRPSKKVNVICHGCGIPMIILNCKYKNSIRKEFYHSRDCYWKNGEFPYCGSHRSKYTTHYYCRHCNNFIRKNEAPIHTSKNGKRKYPVCPDSDCPNFPLKTRPARTNRYEKLKKELVEQREREEKKQSQQLVITVLNSKNNSNKNATT